MNARIGQNISEHTSSCGKVSLKSAQVRRTICAGEKEITRLKYKSSAIAAGAIRGRL